MDFETINFEQIAREFEKVDSSQFESLVQNLFSNDVYLIVIFLDFTYLNKVFDSYEPGNQLRNQVENLLKSKNIFYNRVSSKFFVFSNKADNSNLKAEINNIMLNFKTINKDRIDENKKLIYFIDRENKNVVDKNSFIIKKFDGDIYFYLNTVFNIEKEMSYFRYKNQDYLLELQGLNSRKKLEQLQLRYSKLYCVNEKKIYFFSSKKTVDKNYIQRLLSVKKLISSMYIKQILQYLLEKIEDKNFNIQADEFIRKNVVKYFIWHHQQKLLTIAEMIEKISTNVNNPHEKNEKEDYIIGLEDKNDIINWYQSTIAKFNLPILSLEQRKLISEIKSLIDKLVKLDENYNKNISENKSNLKYINMVKKQLRDKIRLFTNNFHIKGIYSIPFEKIRPSSNSINFFEVLFSLKFAEFYKQKLDEWFKQPFIKSGYYLFVKEPVYLFESNFFLNPDLIETAQKNKRPLFTHLCFLEIDGFNAFNTYYFPNDTDNIIYTKILDSIFEISKKYLNKYENLFKTINYSALGDEFFFSFLSENEIKSKEQKIIEGFLEEIRKTILKIAENIHFIKTKKIIVKTRNGEVVYRKIIKKSKFKNQNLVENFLSDDIELNIGTLGVTGVYSINNIFNTKENFIKSLSYIETQMNLIKDPEKKEAKNLNKIIRIN